MKHKVITKIVLTTVCLLDSAASASTWYVNGVSGSDNNGCTAATSACKTIGHAISLASSGDSIMVAAATYAESLGINTSVKIIGSGAATTIIDGGRRHPVLGIGGGVQVAVSGLTIRNGYFSVSWSGCCQNVFAGSGIYNSGTLTISKSTVSGNIVSATVKCPVIGSCGGGVYGGGIYNNGTLVINDSAVSGNGAYISGCSMQQACVAYGGGIFNNAKLTINNSTIRGNGAGGLHSRGGGIYNNGATVRASNMTLSGNGAIFGGNIAGNVTIQNSIIANNSSGGNCGGSVTSNGYNLSSDGSCNFNNTGDLNNTNPLLGTLGNYGGPTQTIPLLPGSPAIDAGNPIGCKDSNGNLLKTDQRGMPRPNPEDTGGCDMGAYERQSD